MVQANKPSFFGGVRGGSPEEHGRPSPHEGKPAARPVEQQAGRVNDDARSTTKGVIALIVTFFAPVIIDFIIIAAISRDVGRDAAKARQLIKIAYIISGVKLFLFFATLALILTF
ncbi:hypothetical protein JXA12_02035 [Candidatus Woesearchaeota archaeon]|nr:hypothetical protein [Candidatus Woesearchaeota archaeon]